MIVTPRIAVRLALIVIVAVIVQVSFFSFLSILGATPYVVPVVVVCLGLLGGGVVGAVCGFFAGLLMDSLLLQTLGVSSLVLLSIGYLAGRYREGFEIRNEWVNDEGLAQEYTMWVRMGEDPTAGPAERVEIIGILLFGDGGLRGERLYVSEACLKLMFGPLLDETEPV